VSAGLAPKVIHRNLSPAELYEMVRGAFAWGAPTPRELWSPPLHSSTCSQARISRSAAPHARARPLLTLSPSSTHAHPHNQTTHHKTKTKQALTHEKDTLLTETGALAARSGEKTGRSPKDKRVVREPTTEKDVWWAGAAAASGGGAGGSPNFEMDERCVAYCRLRAPQRPSLPPKKHPTLTPSPPPLKTPTNPPPPQNQTANSSSAASRPSPTSTLCL
jgi:hypothetical protein